MHYDDPPVGDGNRLTVFALPSIDAVQRIASKRAGIQNLAGFYQPRAEGCLAFVPLFVNKETTGGLDTSAVFFHEYTHHLQLQNLDRPYPIWLVEGFATFMQTAQIQRDGSVLLGAAPEERAWGLLSVDSIPLTALLTAGHEKLTPAQRDIFYGEGWLLTHYLQSTQSRAGQITRYLDLLNSGTPRLDAAQQAFGDLKQLQHELTLYKHQSSLMGMKVGANHIQIGPVEVTPLSPGGEAMIMLRANVKLYGDKKEIVEPLAPQVRAIEARFAGDELVETTLAEAELDAGNAAAAETAADRALRANPKDVEALIYKGRATAEQARKLQGAEREKAFEQAREILISANKIDTEDPEPLYEFYKSYLVEGVRPNENAIAAMHYASDLVPQDAGLRMNSAIAYLNENKLKEARATLAPVAYSPHGGGAAEAAQTMIAMIDKGDVRGALMSLRKSDAAAGAAPPSAK
jgi:tetratricopeptide (TPR) repeat protein